MSSLQRTISRRSSDYELYGDLLESALGRLAHPGSDLDHVLLGQFASSHPQLSGDIPKDDSSILSQLLNVDGNRWPNIYNWAQYLYGPEPSDEHKKLVATSAGVDVEAFDVVRQQHRYSMIFSLGWLYSGLPTLRLPGPLCAAFALTDDSDDSDAPLMNPWNCFRIVVPSGVILWSETNGKLTNINQIYIIGWDNLAMVGVQRSVGGIYKLFTGDSIGSLRSDMRRFSSEARNWNENQKRAARAVGNVACSVLLHLAEASPKKIR